jgi:hypothetical protein
MIIDTTQAPIPTKEYRVTTALAEAWAAYKVGEAARRDGRPYDSDYYFTLRYALAKRMRGIDDIEAGSLIDGITYGGEADLTSLYDLLADIDANIDDLRRRGSNP